MTKSFHHLHLTAVALLATATPALAVPVNGDPVLFWHEQFLSVLAGPPPVLGRQQAMLGVAVHDAVNGALGRPNFGYTGSIETAGGDVRAATSSAAHAILTTFYASGPKRDQLDAALAASLALVPDGAAKTAGIAYGAKIAGEVVALRANDGSSAVVPYTPSGLPGGWKPTPPASAPFAFTQLATTDPWLLNTQSQLRPVAPPTLDSAAYADAFNEVKDIGAAGSVLRSADQTAAATWWATTHSALWIRAGIDMAESSGSSTLENAVTFARLGVATYDAFIATWDAKIHYDLWRPITAIREADTDGNAGTAQDGGWNSLLTNPAYAAYSSGLSALAGAGSRTLAESFGDTTAFCITYAQQRCWTSLSAAAEEGAMSRLWGGIHFRFDNDAGLALGRGSAEWAMAQNTFAAVPEPASWAMLITGFGLVGAIARRRRNAVSLPRTGHG